MELWDAYDAEGNRLTDRVLLRGEPIPDGCYHLVSDILVQHIDGTYLLMQRDCRKHFGGMWEASAGGSALQGESAYDCALRELREETGIVAEGLQEVGRILHQPHHTLYVEFLCVTSQEKTSVVLQEGETQDYRWVDRDTLRSMKKEELITERMQNFVKALQ